MNMEERHLAEADRHIAEGEQRIADQEQRLEALEAAGRDVTEGKRLLANFRETLAEMRIHRTMILAALGRPA
jgi:uncharacterized coiled-coil protein SlyX